MINSFEHDIPELSDKTYFSAQTKNRRLWWDFIGALISFSATVLILFAPFSPIIIGLATAIMLTMGSAISMAAIISKDNKKTKDWLELLTKIYSTMKNSLKVLKKTIKNSGDSKTFAALGLSAVMAILMGPIFVMAYTALSSIIWCASAAAEIKKKPDIVNAIYGASSALNLAATILFGLMLFGAAGLLGPVAPILLPTLVIASLVGYLFKKYAKYRQHKDNPLELQIKEPTEELVAENTNQERPDNQAVLRMQQGFTPAFGQFQSRVDYIHQNENQQEVINQQNAFQNCVFSNTESVFESSERFSLIGQ